MTQADGVPLDAPKPRVNEVISVETARMMMTMLKAVTTYGTAAVASSLHHPFGGKTGTTNDYTDAWFIGFSPSVTAGVWIGFDNRQSLGEKETGAKAALPIWMDFMRAAIDGKDDETFPAEGAPKKHLEVAVTEDADKPEAPDASAAPDTPEDSKEPKTAEPVPPPTPVPPVSAPPVALPPPDFP